MQVIEVEDLWKRYRRKRRKTTAVGGLTFSVPEGGVFGFLGPNGSGKTTTIRCLLRLIRPTSGRVQVLGVDSQQIHKVLPLIGSIVETPTFFPRYSGLHNLLHLATVVGRGRREALSVIERVGLSGREDDPVRSYSLGMKQRLGLAAALLKDPQLLLLDEPAHGLDPDGIQQIRGLLRELANEGRTVVLSSHLLAEVEAICDNVAIIRAGKCIREGPVQQLLSELGPAVIRIQADDSAKVIAVLRARGYDANPEGNAVRVVASEKQAGEINELLAGAGIYASEIRPDVRTLEEAYIQITRGAE